MKLRRRRTTTPTPTGPPAGTDDATWQRVLTRARIVLDMYPLEERARLDQLTAAVREGFAKVGVDLDDPVQLRAAFASMDVALEASVHLITCQSSQGIWCAIRDVLLVLIQVHDNPSDTAVEQ